VRLGGQVGLVPEDEGALRLAHGLRQAGDADGEAPGRRPHVGAHGGEGLRARAHDDDPGATPGRLAHAELDDRLLVGRVAADHDDEVRLVQVAELRPGPRAQRAEPVAGDAEAADARAGEQAHELARQEALLDGRAGPDQDARRGGAAEHDRGGVDGLLERDLAYLVALPDEPVAQAVGRPAERVAPAALVADPPLLDRVVRFQAAGHAAHGALADGQLRVAPDRAEGAAARGVRDVPRAPDEAVGRARERPHRAEVDDVAREAPDVGLAAERRDLGARAALLEGQLTVPGDVLAEADAAEARDAALAVDRDERREVERLGEVALGLDEARAPGAELERAVLQRALAALVAHRAVERVVLEQELQHA